MKYFLDVFIYLLYDGVFVVNLNEMNEKIILEPVM